MPIHGEIINKQLHIANNGAIKPLRCQFLDHAWNGIDTAWASEHDTGAFAIQDLDNGWYRHTTGAVDDNEQEIDWNDNVSFTNTKRPSFEIYLKVDQASDVRIAFGLKEKESVGADDYIKIEVDSDTDTQWYLKTSNAGTETTDVGSALSTNATAFKFEFDGSDTAINWYMATSFNLLGVPAWTIQGSGITTNIPTVSLQPFITVQVRNDGGARYIQWDYVIINQDLL